MDESRKIKKPYITIDPRSKIIIFTAVACTAFGLSGKLIEVISFTYILLLMINAKQFKISFLCTALFTAMMLSDIYIAPMLTGAVAVLFLTVVRVFRMVIPMMLGMLLIIRTITVSEFIASFKRMYVSDKIIIPVSVMFRFIPTIKEEWQSVSSAMKFRGISLSLKNLITNPMVTLEYMLVPMLMSASNISGELAAASLSRGLDTDKKRTCIMEIRFGLIDGLITLTALGLITLMLLKRVGIIT